MKKALIAGAASTIALAAMPMAGVFALDPAEVGTAGFTDTVKVTINASCNMKAAVSGTDTANTPMKPEADIAFDNVTPANAAAAKSGTAMTISCNDNTGWNVKAKPTDMKTSDNKYTIPYGTYAGTSQATSVWSAQFSNGSDTNSVITTGNGAYASSTLTTSQATAIVTHSTTDSTINTTTGSTITPSYIVYAQAGQATGAYTGTITYTFAQGAA